MLSPGGHRSATVRPQGRQRTPKATQGGAKCSQKPGPRHHQIDEKSHLRLQGVPGRSWGTPLAPKMEKIHTFPLILRQRLEKKAMVPFFNKASQIGRRRRPTCDHLHPFSMDSCFRSWEKLTRAPSLFNTWRASRPSRTSKVHSCMLRCRCTHGVKLPVCSWMHT